MHASEIGTSNRSGYQNMSELQVSIFYFCKLSENTRTRRNANCFALSNIFNEGKLMQAQILILIITQTGQIKQCVHGNDNFHFDSLGHLHSCYELTHTKKQLTFISNFDIKRSRNVIFWLSNTKFTVNYIRTTRTSYSYLKQDM